MTFSIQQLVAGKYLNSQPRWRSVGEIEADSPEQAAVLALLSTGSSQIRVVPTLREPWQRSGDEWKQSK